MPPASPAVELEGIVKRFPGVVANDHVSFEAAAGEVHALLGENGAGKSTLSNVLTGLYRPDEGEIRLEGRVMHFVSPRDAIDAGVCMVHQHFRLVPTFTVAENVVLGDTLKEGRRFFLGTRRVEQQVRELGERYGMAVEPRARIWQLAVGEQQRVEILKALYRDARVLILDEPTSVLTPQEADRLFETLRQIASEGRTVIFISHKLHEVMAVSDRVTVLRAGRNVETVSTAGASARSLAALMVGHDVTAVQRTGVHRVGEAVLEVSDLWVDGDRGLPAVRGAGFEVHAGEIVAVAGVSGNGQRELAEAISGMRRPTRGEIRICGRKLHCGDPREAIDAGLAHIPEDRQHTGVAGGLSLAMNLALKDYRTRSLGPFLRLGSMREQAEKTIEAYDVKTPGPRSSTGSLSGGNLQKVVLAREFDGEPKVLIAASPTRGLDVAAVANVHEHLIDAVERGVGVLLISEDLDEILTLEDRVLVMYEGRLTEAPTVDVPTVGLLMAGEELHDHEHDLVSAPA
ncbi:MAG: ABC transporter ATP-binding protein [Gaiellaceae bacterium]